MLVRTPLLMLIAVAALMASLPAIVSAQGVPPPPQRFFGSVTIDGRSAPVGTTVAAWANGQQAAMVVTTTVGSYPVLEVSGLSPGTSISFRVNGVEASETADWQQGSLTRLNLTASSTAVPLLTPPHAFSGLVTIDGSAVTGGVEISAIIEEVVIAATLTSSDGRYKLKVQQGTQSFVGKTVTFTIDGQIAIQSALWRQGGVDLLNLSIYRGPQLVADVFASLIRDGSLVVVWMYHNDTKTWSVFDPRPEAAPLNDLAEVSSGDILWVEVSRQRVFQGRPLYEGWNLMVLH